MLRLSFCLCALWAVVLLADDKPPATAPPAPPAPAPIDATAALNDARDKLGDQKAYQGTLPLTVEKAGQEKLTASFAIAYQSPNQLRVESTHEDAEGKESVLFVLGPEAIWAQGRSEPKGGAAEVQVRKVLVDKIDAITLGLLNRVKKVEGIPYLLFGRPGLLLEYVGQCCALTATASADGKEVTIEAKRDKAPQGLDEAADVLSGMQVVRITVAKDDWRLLDVSIEGTLGGKIGVSYRTLALGKAPEAAVFDYKPPAGVDVHEVDERMVKPGPPGAEPPKEPPKEGDNKSGPEPPK